MGLLFIDGFDHYTTDEHAKKWDIKSGTWLTQTSYGGVTSRIPGSRFAYNSSGGNYLRKNLSAVETTLVAGIAFYKWGAPAQTIFQFGNSDSMQIDCKINTDGSVQVYRYTTSLGASSGGLVSLSNWYYIELKVLIHDSTGTVDVWLNGVSILSLSSQDTHHSGNVEFNYAQINGAFGLDDFYLDDATNHGDCRIDTLMPDGAGNYTQFDPSAGNNYECVDDPADIDEDTTYVSTSTVDEIDTYDVDDLSTLAGSTIYGLAVNNCCRKDDAGTRKFKALTRVNGSDYEGSEITLTDTYKVYQQLWENNPDDAAAWEEADVDGGEYGLKLTV